MGLEPSKVEIVDWQAIYVEEQGLVGVVQKAHVVVDVDEMLR